MKSKEIILNKLRKNKPLVPDIEINADFDSSIDVLEEFQEAIKKVGGSILSLQSIQNWNTWIRQTYGIDLNVYSEIEGFEGNYTVDAQINKSQLNKIDIAILQGDFGVAENGAIWVEKFAFRVIPFITQHLILTLSRSNIISNMHEAYAEFAEFGLPDFGVFISGPSKTADIEQSLVYGAHGPKTLTVVIV